MERRRGRVSLVVLNSVNNSYIELLLLKSQTLVFIMFLLRKYFDILGNRLICVLAKSEMRRSMPISNLFVK